MAGSQCCDNPPTIFSRDSGNVEVLGGLKSYISGVASNRAILLISDVFGFEAPNLRKLADKIAAQDFYVVVPDFFFGEPFVPEKYSNILDWLNSHQPDQGFENAKSVISALADKGISAIGAAGFCWGAKVTAELAKTGNVCAAVMLHPSLVTVEDIKAVKCPLSILAAEIDNITPPQLVKQFEEILSSNSELASHVEIFGNVAHGWTVRYNVEDELAVERADEAHKKMLKWFLEHLPRN